MLNQEVLEYVDNAVSKALKDLPVIPEEKSEKTLEKKDREIDTHHHNHHIPPYKYGEYMLEENDINIKLLHIPLVQVCSGTKRMRMPITDDCYFY